MDLNLSLDIPTLRNFAIALAIGALVGIEREKNKAESGSIGIGGVRTFILFSQVGAVGAWLARALDAPWIFIAAVAIVAASALAGYLATTRARPESLGLTTEMAAVSVALLGGLSLAGYPGLAVALGILTSAALAFKGPMHGLVEKLGTDDIYAGLKLLIATFIILPVLPDHPVDPWGALNPHTLWLLVILISTLSLIGYVAVRILGPSRGSAVTGLAGGLASSTAATLHFARRAGSEKSAASLEALLTGMLLAWAVMFVRIIVEVAVVNPDLLPPVLAPMIAMGAAALAAAAYFYRSSTREKDDETSHMKVKNPFSLTAASQFGLLFAAILLVVHLTRAYLPDGSIYVVSAVAGLTDVDAITLSLAESAKRGGDLLVPARGIAIAAFSNTAVKCAMFALLGGHEARRPALVATALIILAGAVALLF
ncbi:MAG: MgtC/SapB family protein [Gammaproteobacteria bacterium]